MPDPIELIDRIAADLSTVRWPGATEIRRTARVRRRRRVAVAAALTVVAVAGVSLAALDHRAPLPVTRYGAAGPSPTGEQVVIPDGVLLAADEIGPALEAQVSSAEAFQPTRMALDLDLCVRDKKLAIAHRTRYQREQTVLKARAAGEEHLNSDFVLNQSLYRLTAADAATYMADVRRAVAACDRWQSKGTIERGGKHVDAVGEYRFAVVAEDFAGDESIQLSDSSESWLGTGERIGTSGPGLTVFVRVGDLVTVIGPRASTAADQLRRWSVIAARRMCRAANPGC
jgi:hypothetical protein